MSWLWLFIGTAFAESLFIDFAGPSKPSPGETLYAAGDNVRIRAAPSVSAALITELSMGTPVVVADDAPVPGIVGEREGAWIPVRVADQAGWSWAGTLTRARNVLDIDNDGEDEVVTVAYGADGALVVRVGEPKVAAEDRVSFVQVGPFTDSEGILRRTSVTWLAATEAGVPLVRLEAQAGEYCGSGSQFAYVAAVSAGQAQPSKATLALTHPGSGGDAPIWWETRATFFPDRKEVEVVETSGEEQQTHDTRTQRWVWKDGVFVRLPAAAPQK